VGTPSVVQYSHMAQWRCAARDPLQVHEGHVLIALWPCSDRILPIAVRDTHIRAEVKRGLPSDHESRAHLPVLIWHNRPSCSHQRLNGQHTVWSAGVHHARDPYRTHPGRNSRCREADTHGRPAPREPLRPSSENRVRLSMPGRQSRVHPSRWIVASYQADRA
jgi:hypothetical protein